MKMDDIQIDLSFDREELVSGELKEMTSLHPQSCDLTMQDQIDYVERNEEFEDYYKSERLEDFLLRKPKKS